MNRIENKNVHIAKTHWKFECSWTGRERENIDYIDSVVLPFFLYLNSESSGIWRHLPNNDDVFVAIEKKIENVPEFRSEISRIFWKKKSKSKMIHCEIWNTKANVQWKKNRLIFLGGCVWLNWKKIEKLFFLDSGMKGNDVFCDVMCVCV